MLEVPSNHTVDGYFSAFFLETQWAVVAVEAKQNVGCEIQDCTFCLAASSVYRLCTCDDKLCRHICLSWSVLNRSVHSCLQLSASVSFCVRFSGNWDYQGKAGELSYALFTALEGSWNLPLGFVFMVCLYCLLLFSRLNYLRRMLYCFSQHLSKMSFSRCRKFICKQR